MCARVRHEAWFSAFWPSSCSQCSRAARHNRPSRPRRISAEAGRDAGGPGDAETHPGGAGSHIPDVLELVRKGVPGGKIVAYLRSTRASYNYTQAQINTLLNAGADSTLVNYVGRGAGDFPHRRAERAIAGGAAPERKMEKGGVARSVFQRPGLLGRSRRFPTRFRRAGIEGRAARRSAPSGGIPRARV